MPPTPSHPPETVLDEDELHRRDCVACVTAVLFNQTNEEGRFAYASDVSRKYSVTDVRNVQIALKTICGFTELDPTPGQFHPWSDGARAGHFAVFILGSASGHVIYGHRDAHGIWYLHDPQVDRTFHTLQGIQNPGDRRVSVHFSGDDG